MCDAHDSRFTYLFEQDRIKSEDEEYSPVTFPYASLIGELMWIASNVRPDILFATQVLSSYLLKPRDIHVTAAKRILRYLRETKDLGLMYQTKDIKFHDQLAIPTPTTLPT